MLSNNVQAGSLRGGPGGGDIICLVKRHISDGQLSQPPLLVLPDDRIARANWNVRTKYLRLHLSSFSNYVLALFPNQALPIFRSCFPEGTKTIIQMPSEINVCNWQAPFMLPMGNHMRDVSNISRTGYVPCCSTEE